MEFDAVLLAPRRAEAIAQGWWHERTINDELDACVREHPDKTALTAVSLESGLTRRFSYSELAALAAGLENGTLRPEDNVLVGGVSGKIKSMFSDSGKRLRYAEPSTPIGLQAMARPQITELVVKPYTYVVLFTDGLRIDGEVVGDVRAPR